MFFEKYIIRFRKLILIYLSATKTQRESLLRKSRTRVRSPSGYKCFIFPGGEIGRDAGTESQSLVSVLTYT